jgi:mersacidin/lichenicidin family type 2 lantibiotic
MEDTMSNLDIIRAWRDPDYRLSLSDAERKQLPEHPAGLVELNDIDLEGVVGSRGPKNTSPQKCGK